MSLDLLAFPLLLLVGATPTPGSTSTSLMDLSSLCPVVAPPTIKPVGVCNDINFNNILNRRPASSASNADKNRGHRIDCLLCQITGNNDAEMGVEGGGTRYLTAGITDKEDDLTVVNGTEYLTAGNNNEVVGGCNVRRLRNIQWDQSKDVDLAGLYFTAKFVAKLC